MEARPTKRLMEGRFKRRNRLREVMFVYLITGGLYLIALVSMLVINVFGVGALDHIEDKVLVLVG